MPSTGVPATTTVRRSGSNRRLATRRASSTVTAAMVPAERLATSYGALGTVNGVAKFVSSAAVGLAWSLHSPAAGFALAAVLMLAGTLALDRSR